MGAHLVEGTNLTTTMWTCQIISSLSHWKDHEIQTFDNFDLFLVAKHSVIPKSCFFRLTCLSKGFQGCFFFSDKQLNPSPCDREIIANTWCLWHNTAAFHPKSGTHESSPFDPAEFLSHTIGEPHGYCSFAANCGPGTKTHPAKILQRSIVNGEDWFNEVKELLQRKIWWSGRFLVGYALGCYEFKHVIEFYIPGTQVIFVWNGTTTILFAGFKPHNTSFLKNPQQPGTYFEKEPIPWSTHHFKSNPHIFITTFRTNSWKTCNKNTSLGKSSICNASHTRKQKPSWWFQPIWKILVKLDHFPR